MLTTIMLQIQILQLQVLVLMKRLEKRLAILRMAEASLGVDISPLDVISDEFSCAESVSWVLKKAIGFPIITGTWSLWKYLQNDSRFEEVMIPEPGCIIISPTGTGNGKIRGHVGVVGEGENIMSADSITGIWKINYTQQTWEQRYQNLGSMPIYYYRLIV